MMRRQVAVAANWSTTVAAYWKEHYDLLSQGFFLYGDRKPHCWNGSEGGPERLKQMAVHIMAHKPDGATTPWWSY